MARLMPEPTITFFSKQETIQALFNPEWKNRIETSLNVKSIWLCQQMDEYEKTVGFPYNASFQSWIEKKENIGSIATGGSPLSTLIYYAQLYRESDRLREEGWVPPRAELLNEAIAQNKKIEVLLESVFGDRIQLCRIVLVNGTYYAIPPKKRTRGYVLYGNPIRFPKDNAARETTRPLF